MKEISRMDNDLKTYICVICGKKCKGYPNSAAPVDDGPCCDECNANVVIPARIKAFYKNNGN